MSSNDYGFGNFPTITLTALGRRLPHTDINPKPLQTPPHLWHASKCPVNPNKYPDEGQTPSTRLGFFCHFFFFWAENRWADYVSIFSLGKSLIMQRSRLLSWDFFLISPPGKAPLKHDSNQRILYVRIDLCFRSHSAVLDLFSGCEVAPRWTWAALPHACGGHFPGSLLCFHNPTFYAV